MCLVIRWACLTRKLIAPARCAVIFLVAGAISFGLGGFLLAHFFGQLSPDYYRSVFRSGSDPRFDPVEVAAGLGLLQGVSLGLVFAALAFLLVACERPRILVSQPSTGNN
jgi:hypothetical protein